MRQVTRTVLQVSILTSSLLPMPAMALPAMTCHCFTDRSYNRAQPSLADPYFLATAQNAFFALVFETDKRSIVMKKQQGISAEDLWIAYWVASKGAASPDTLLQAKHKGDSWKKTVAGQRLAKPLGARFSTPLNENASDLRLSKAVVDDLLLKERLLDENDLAWLRKAGATNQELILATVIATKTLKPVRKLYGEVRSGTSTWGSLLSAAKVDTAQMQKEVAGILRLPRQ